MKGAVVFITGASAGLGRAIARLLSSEGASIGLIARDEDALKEVARELDGPCAVAAADVAIAVQLEAAAATLVQELGAPDIWVNNAMATIFSRFDDITPEEFARATSVTFLGSVHGMQQALKYMKPRGRGHIIQIGSALAYRAIPLQAPYCAAKFATRAVADSLRCELLHDASPLRITTVHMPAMNTPQFEWSARHVAQEPRPVAPVYSPDACARAVAWAARHPDMREVWVGRPTVMAILSNKLMPAFMDRYLSSRAFEGQFDRPADAAEMAGNLFEPVAAAHRTKGRFADEELQQVHWVGTSARREWITVGAATGAAVIVVLVILVLA